MGIVGSNLGTVSSRRRQRILYPFPVSYQTEEMAAAPTCGDRVAGISHGSSSKRALLIAAYRRRPRPRGHRPLKRFLMTMALKGMSAMT